MTKYKIAYTNNSTDNFILIENYRRSLITYRSKQQQKQILNALNLKILLTEDNLILQTVFSDFLTTLNCTNVDTARTGRQALSLYEKHKYALILLDIGLPDINGIEVCKKIRKQEDHTPVVAITAYDTARQECRQAGFNDFALNIKRQLFFPVGDNYLCRSYS